MSANICDVHMRDIDLAPNKHALLRNLRDGIDSLQTQVEALPFCIVRESHIVAMERSLVGLRSQLYGLRGFVDKDATL